MAILIKVDSKRSILSSETKIYDLIDHFTIAIPQ